MTITPTLIREKLAAAKLDAIALEKDRADARALKAVRVLDAWAAKHASPLGVNSHDIGCSGNGERWAVFIGERKFEHAGSPDAARIAAAEALLAEDPSLGDGL